MTTSQRECVIFRGEELLPEAWQQQAANGPVRTFNPGLLRSGHEWLLAYRIVTADGTRRIGLCRLDSTLRVVPGSPIPWSDHVSFRRDVTYPEVTTRWFADPRLYRFANRLFIYWNSGWHEPRNYQFLQELDPTTLRPRGHPREMILRGERQKLEKNWTLFESSAGELRAVYSILPHVVLRFSLEGDDDVVFEPVARTDWQLKDYPACHGGLRGGAPPVFHDGNYWSFCHSVHDGANGYRYSPAAYAFRDNSSFAPTIAPLRPIPLGNPFGEQRTYERLNPAVGEVIYPCGAARDGARWLVSHGINDEYCAISSLTHEEILATTRSLE